MSQGEAQTAMNAGYDFVIRAWGDDPRSDDLIRNAGRFEGWQVTPQGAYLHTSLVFTPHELDEDDSITDDHDEIYIGGRFVDRSGGTLRLAESNRVYLHI